MATRKEKWARRREMFKLRSRQFRNMRDEIVESIADEGLPSKVAKIIDVCLLDHPTEDIITATDIGLAGIVDDLKPRGAVKSIIRTGLKWLIGRL